MGGVWSSMGTMVRLLHMCCWAVRCSCLRAVVHGHGRIRLRWVWLSAIRRRIRLRHLLRTRIVARIVAAVIFTPAVVATCWLRHIRHYLHASRNRSRRPAAAGRISRCRRTTEPFVELFQ